MAGNSCCGASGSLSPQSCAWRLPQACKWVGPRSQPPKASFKKLIRFRRRVRLSLKCAPSILAEDKAIWPGPPQLHLSLGYIWGYILLGPEKLKPRDLGITWEGC